MYSVKICVSQSLYAWVIYWRIPFQSSIVSPRGLERIQKSDAWDDVDPRNMRVFAVRDVMKNNTICDSPYIPHVKNGKPASFRHRLERESMKETSIPQASIHWKSFAWDGRYHILCTCREKTTNDVNNIWRDRYKIENTLLIYYSCGFSREVEKSFKKYQAQIHFHIGATKGFGKDAYC